MVTKKIRHKNAAGTVYEYDIGAKAENVEQDADHRFASDEEKENWNGKIGADTQIEFKEAESRQNINTKETLGTILGKVKKFFTDLKPHAFYDLVQNATTAAVDRAVSAAVAKSLQDQINQQNTKLKPYTQIFASTALVGSGIIEDIADYNDFIILVSASGFITAHNVTKECLLDGPIFTSSYYYNEAQHGMATIQLYAGGAYQIAQGLDQNSVDSSIAIYAR